MNLGDVKFVIFQTEDIIGSKDFDGSSTHRGLALNDAVVRRELYFTWLRCHLLPQLTMRMAGLMEALRHSDSRLFT